MVCAGINLPCILVRDMLLRRIAVANVHAGTYLRAARGLTTTNVPSTALNYCVELVAQHDRERYLCNLHAPEAARPGLFALHAFNYETAAIRTATTQESASIGRFRFWRDALDKAMAGQPPDHPVAEALAYAHWRYGLTSRYLTQLLDAREADLRVKQPRDRAELREYCEATGGALLLLGLECAGVSDCEEAEHAASQAGIAHGMATLLRGTAVHASRGTTYLPAETTTLHGVRLSDMLRGKESAALSDAVAEIADEAIAHLLAARAFRDDVPADARAVLLPATLADHVLRNLQRHGYSPFAPGVGAPLVGPRMQMALWWSKLTGTY